MYYKTQIKIKRERERGVGLALTSSVILMIQRDGDSVYTLDKILHVMNHRVPPSQSDVVKKWENALYLSFSFRF